MIQPTIRGLESPAAAAISPYVETRPAGIEATPVAYLRQMASYRAVLRTIFPGRQVRCALVWTREARVSVLPDVLLDPHEPGGSSARQP